MKQTLWLKLGSIAVHAEELISPGGHEFDQGALRGLLQDPEVRRFLDAPANKVLLPRKRGEQEAALSRLQVGKQAKNEGFKRLYGAARKVRSR